MSFPILAMPRASLVARVCASNSDIRHRDAYRIDALVPSRTEDASIEAPGAAPSRIAQRIAASTKQE